MAAYLQAKGWDVGHEQMLADGVSDWRLPCVDMTNTSWMQSAETQVIHAIRDPQRTITSMALTTSTESKERLWQTAGITTGGTLEKICRGYLAWHAIIQTRWQVDMTVRVDDSSDLDELDDQLHELNTGLFFPMGRPSTKTNARPHDELPLKMWTNLPPVLLEELHKFSSAHRYLGAALHFSAMKAAQQPTTERTLTAHVSQEVKEDAY